MANDAYIRLVSYDVIALFISIPHKTGGCRTIEYIDSFLRNLLMYKLVKSTSNEYESVFVRDQSGGDRQFWDPTGHMYMIKTMGDLFGFF